MNHLQSNKAIFEAYIGQPTAPIVEQTSGKDTQYVSISTIQRELKVALDEMLTPLYQLIQIIAKDPSPRKINDLHKELTNGDAGLVVPMLPLVVRRPTLDDAVDVVKNHAYMVLPKDILKWAESAPQDAVLVIRDDLNGERTVATVPVSSLDL